MSFIAVLIANNSLIVIEFAIEIFPNKYKYYCFYPWVQFTQDRECPDFARDYLS